MEQRLIDANALWELMRTYDDYQGAKEAHDLELIHRDSILFAIENAPTVDAVQVVHSSWSVFAEMDLRERRTGKHILVCRECGHTEKIHHSDKMPNYCQNCGAKMDGGKADKEWFCAEGERKDGDRK